MKELKSDVPADISLKALEELQKTVSLFKDFRKNELEILSAVIKTLNFQRNSIIVKKNEEAVFMAFLYTGRVLILQSEKIIAAYESGTIFGFYSFFELNGSKVQKFDFKGEKEGHIGILLYSDIRSLEKKNPIVFFKLCKMMFALSLEMVTFQLKGENLNGRQFNIQMETPEYRLISDQLKIIGGFGAFFHSLDRTGQRFLLNLVKVYDFNSEVG